MPGLSDPLAPEDFPVVANGQYVYRRTTSGAFVGPISMQLAADIAKRLNRDEEIRLKAIQAALHGEPLLVHGSFKGGPTG